MSSVIRQKWDYRFLEMAALVSTWSKDPSTQVGAVITRPDRVVVGLGYNGFPRGVPDDERLLNVREEKYARVVHAEMNAILNANGSTEGCTLHVWPPGPGPTCERCAAHVIQAGINRVVGVLSGPTDFDERWSKSCLRAQEMYEHAGVQVVMYPLATWQSTEHFLADEVLQRDE